ncbi:MAG: AIPR family protein [archaeon]
MPLKGIIFEKIKTFIKDYSELDTKTESEQIQIFCLFHILKEYELDIEDIFLGIVDGGDDFGIDAMYSMIDGHVINTVEDIDQFLCNQSQIIIKIIQTKKENGFSEEALLKLKDGLEDIFEIDKVLVGNKEFNDRANIIRELWKKWHASGNKNKFDVGIQYVSLGKKEDINHKVIDKKNKIIEFLTYIGLKNSDLSFIDQKDIFDLSSVHKYHKIINTIKSVPYDFEHNKEIRGYITIVDGREFYNFITDDNDKIDDKIFEANVRDYQGDKKEVINNIKETLNSSKKCNFWCMNNGITILSSKIEPKRDTFRLENYQIINGCQTSYSIWEVLKDNKELKNFEIIVKFVETDDDDTALEIIQATNSQIPIDPTSIKSQERVHKTIEEFLKSGKDAVYYERRKNFYKRRNYPLNKIIDPKKLFQVVRSIYFKKPSSSRRNPTEFFEKEHDTIFNLDHDFLYFKFACNLFLKVVQLIKDYKKEYDLDDFELVVANNGSLHISRVLSSLILGNDLQIKLNNKANKLIKEYDTFIQNINNLNVEEGGLFIQSVDILEKSLTHYGIKEGKYPVPTILKNQDFDDKFLNKEIKNYFDKKQI